MANKCIKCNALIEKPLSFSNLIKWKAIDEDLVCDDCFAKFQPTQSDFNCKNCSKPLSLGELCDECEQWLQLYPGLKGRHHSLFRYDDYAKEWMISFKMKGDIRYGLVFGEVLREKIKKDFPRHLLVPIPSSSKHLLERGFNQIDVILSVLLVDFARLLENNSKDQNQAKKTREERLKTQQPFNYIGDGDLREVEILLIDDVYTTGRTLYHAKDILTQQGARRVDSLSLFR